MAGAFKNVCAVCGEPFKEQDKAIATALVVVTKGGYSNRQGAGKLITSKEVQIRFRSHSKRSLVHLSCLKEDAVFD